jgi:hypothetical protein
MGSSSMDAGTGWKRLVVMEGAEMAGATVGDATSFMRRLDTELDAARVAATRPLREVV